MVEGTFARAFKSGLRPVEIGRRLTREMDNNRSVGVSGRTMVPNQFTIWLSPADMSRFEAMHDRLVAELSEAAREHAKDESYGFVGPITIDLQESERMA